MNQKLLQLFPGWSAKFEGRVPWMYLDIRGIVTVCVGNALFSPDAAIALPFVHKDMVTPATERQKANEYVMIRDMKILAKQGHLAAAQYATLRLTDDAMDDLVRAKMSSNHEQMKNGQNKDYSWPDMDTWPIDALLATHSMAWACGPAFDDPGPGRFTKLSKTLKAGDFESASKECHMNEVTPEGLKNVGLVARNVANKLLYRNAAIVVKEGLDRDRLYWPQDLSKPEVLKLFKDEVGGGAKEDDASADTVRPGAASEADVSIPGLGDSADQPIVHDMNSYFPERNKSWSEEADDVDYV